MARLTMTSEELYKLAMQIEKYGTRNPDLRLTLEAERDIVNALRSLAQLLAKCDFEE